MYFTYATRRILVRGLMMGGVSLGLAMSIAPSYAATSRILTSQQAEKLTFSRLTATPAQWKRWSPKSHQGTFIARNTTGNGRLKRKHFSIRLASYQHHFFSYRKRHHYSM